MSDDLTPCMDLHGNHVCVMVDTAFGPHGRPERFITIGVRDSESNDADLRELIDIEPHEAIRLAWYLLDYAVTAIDASGAVRRMLEPDDEDHGQPLTIVPQPRPADEGDEND